MPLPAPLSTLSSYVTVGFSTARCSACRDTFGNPLEINKNGVRKHIDLAAHITNVTGLKRLRNSAYAKKPQSNLPRVEADTAVDTPTFGFSSSAPLVPESDVPSDLFEDFLTILKHLTPLYDAPNPGDTLRSTSNDLFEDCITHGPPVPKQHGMASDNDNEQQSKQSRSDSEEEGYKSPQAPQTQYRTQPNAPSDQWFPYKSFAMFLADILFSLRRLHFSREQMQAILKFARATGGQNIPCLSTLQRAQEKLKA
ncbi:hypothetical protein RHS04_07769 [Rhizoctonia solani]|uniref:Uncharacterized protein n=1 Tax=Rhizoctonia solani TaxID=456999 RepID=A0A8H7H570_9AGAM|nr:hypothetical protein RHS04_07769 [Rhizoctonia solani]